ncbi:MAG TPA: exonuclease domain-containing protein, partial [Tepidisphaeraceae bacterium]
ETTGASFEYGDRVVELGMIRLEGGEVVASFDRLMNPGRPMSGGAAAVTGITPDMLLGQPSFCDLWSDAKPLLDGAIIVGHNVAFDLSFITGECRRAGRDLQEAGDLHVLDTVRIARKQLGRGGNGLQRLAGRLGVEPTTAHRALADCHTTAGVLHRLLEPHGGWQVPVVRAHELQGGFNCLSKHKPRESPLPTEIAEALIDGLPVNITYLDADHRRTNRSVTPRFVRRLRGHLMLFAHCHLKNAQRTFKVDRILSAAPCTAEDLLSAPS